MANSDSNETFGTTDVHVCISINTCFCGGTLVDTFGVYTLVRKVKEIIRKNGNSACPQHIFAIYENLYRVYS